MYKGFIATLLIMMLSACATSPGTSKLAPVGDRFIPWQQREAKLYDIKNWDIKGSASILHQKKNQIINWQWQQTGDIYEMRLSGPLGVGATYLAGQPGYVTLRDSKGQSYQASNAEALLEQTTGWYLPISNLYYWIRGLPKPGMSSKLTMDAFGRYAVMEQNDWTIHFLSFKRVAEGTDLPTKIQLYNKDISIKLITKW